MDRLRRPPESDPKCKGPGASGFDCVDNTCGKLRIQTSNFVERLHVRGAQPVAAGSRRSSAGGFGATDTVDQTPWYFYGGQQVTVTCYTSDRGQEVSATQTWPG